MGIGQRTLKQIIQTVTPRNVATLDDLKSYATLENLEFYYNNLKNYFSISANLPYHSQGLQIIKKYLGSHFSTTSTSYVVTDGGKMFVNLPGWFFEEKENGYYKPRIYATAFIFAQPKIKARLRLTYIDETGTEQKIYLQESEPLSTEYLQLFLFHDITDYLRKYRYVWLHIDVLSTDGTDTTIFGHSWLGVIYDFGETLNQSLLL